LFAGSVSGGSTEVVYELLIGRRNQEVFEGRVVVETDAE
jgi:hypothetical protein